MTSYTFKLRVPDSLAAFIRALHPDIKSRIKSALQEIIRNPFKGKALKEELKGLYSFRVKRFRIIYKVDQRKMVISIVAVGPRKYIYGETYKILTKQSDPPVESR